jgi:hypothetical protein
MMKLLAFAWLATPCAAFALSPCSQNLPDYRNDLRRAAEAAAPGDYALQIFSLPAFVPESAIRLQGNTIAYIEFKSSLWYKGKARDGVSPLRGVKVRRAVLPAGLADAMAAAMTRHVQAARPSHGYGLDGETTIFDVPRVGCAETWSPDRGTEDANLVELFGLLTHIVNTHNSREKLAGIDDLSRLLMTL